jgi:hypothetical protein
MDVCLLYPGLLWQQQDLKARTQPLLSVLATACHGVQSLSGTGLATLAGLSERMSHANGWSSGALRKRLCEL